MAEKPQNDILNRETAIIDANLNYSNQLFLLHDLANYGSNLILRAYNSSERQILDLIICGTLLKQIVSMADACEVLFSKGCTHAAFLPARAAFEASVYLDWILSENSDRRSKLYLVGNYRQERIWANRAIPGTLEAIRFSQISDSLDTDLHNNSPDLLEGAKSHLLEVNRILEQPAFIDIDNEYEKKLKSDKLRREPEWYKLEGIKSLRELSKNVGRLNEYELFYTKASKVMHASSHKDFISFNGQSVNFKPIRNFDESYILISFISVTCIFAYRKILSHYRPDEIESFSKKYTQDWRDPYMNSNKLKS